MTFSKKYLIHTHKNSNGTEMWCKYLFLEETRCYSFSIEIILLVILIFMSFTKFKAFKTYYFYSLLFNLDFSMSVNAIVLIAISYSTV